jgi:rare lipoprotein A
MTWRPSMALLSLALVASIAVPASARSRHARVKTGHAMVGVASWYDCAKKGQCSRSKITASGERFNPGAMTAAHRSLPFGTRVRHQYKNGEGGRGEDQRPWSVRGWAGD